MDNRYLEEIYMNGVTKSATIETLEEGSSPQIPNYVLPVQRRKHRRYSVEFPLDYSLVNGKTAYNGGFAADASEGGLLVYLLEKIAIGAALRIEIFYVKDLSLETIVATAKTVWTDSAAKTGFHKYKYGLQFLSLDEENLNTLRALLKKVTGVDA